MKKQTKVTKALETLATTASASVNKKALTLTLPITLDAEEWLTLFLVGQSRNIAVATLLCDALCDCDAVTKVEQQMRESETASDIMSMAR